MTRVDSNSPGLTGMYWLWTNTYYLYTIFILTLLLACLSSTALKYSLVTFFILLYVNIMVYETCYNTSMAVCTQPIEDSMNYYNLLLNNCINKLHPMLIYMSWILPAAFFLFVSPQQFISHRTSIMMSKTSMLMLTTLTMGGWWAYQEGSWGGWWNWDPSEMFGLLILGSLLVFSHSDIVYKPIFITYAKSVCLLLIAYYCFLQLNFSLISHNFGIRQGDLVDFRVFYLFVFIMLSLYIFSKNKRKELYYSHNSKKIGTFFLVSMVIYSLLISITYFSTLELWASLTWNILTLDIQHYLNIIPTLNTTLLLMLYVSYSISRSHWLLLVMLSVYFGSSLASFFVTIYCYAYSLAKFKNLHVAMLLALLVLALYSSYTYTTNSPYPVSVVIDAISPNLPLLHLSAYNASGFNLATTSQASSLTSNSIESKLFNLANIAYTTLQDYSISSEDILVNSAVLELYNSFILVAIFLFYYIYSNSSASALIIRF
jgi:cytochrome c biogenesis factor